jgi:hypothetical protein
MQTLPAAEEPLHCRGPTRVVLVIERGEVRPDGGQRAVLVRTGGGGAEGPVHALLDLREGILHPRDDRYGRPRGLCRGGRNPEDGQPSEEDESGQPGAEPERTHKNTRAGGTKRTSKIALSPRRVKRNAPVER